MSATITPKYSGHWRNVILRFLGIRKNSHWADARRKQGLSKILGDRLGNYGSGGKK